MGDEYLVEGKIEAFFWIASPVTTLATLKLKVAEIFGLWSLQMYSKLVCRRSYNKLEQSSLHRETYLPSLNAASVVILHRVVH